MTDEISTTQEPAVEAPPATDVAVAYEDASRLLTSAGSAQLLLFGNVYRDPVRLDGTLKQPLLFREAMATLYAIVGSDYRYVPKDRTAYLAYLRMRKEAASLNVRQSQQAFFEWASATTRWPSSCSTPWSRSIRTRCSSRCSARTRAPTPNSASI